MNITNPSTVINCFYDSSPDCVKVVDTHGILLSFNENGLKTMEIDAANDVIGKSWADFWTGELKETAENALKVAIGGEPAYFEGYCKTFKGTMKFWQVSLTPVKGEDEAVESVIVTSKDSTRLNELEKKVQELETKLSQYE